MMTRDELVTDNRPLAIFHAKRFLGLGLDMDDLTGAAYEALVIAANTWDPARGPFGAYASTVIKRELAKTIAREGSAIRVPYEARTAAWKDAEGVEAADVSTRTRRWTHTAAVTALTGIRLYSLDIPMLTDPTGVTDALPCLQGLRGDVEAAWDALTDEQARVLELRHGLSGGEPMSLREVGEAMGYSKQRAGQVEAKALTALRAAMGL